MYERPNIFNKYESILEGQFTSIVSNLILLIGNISSGVKHARLKGVSMPAA